MISVGDAIRHGRHRDWPVVHLPPDPADTPEYRAAMARAVAARERAERIIESIQHQSNGTAPSRAPAIPERS